MVDPRLESAEWLNEKYWECGLTVGEIGELVGHPSSTVSWKMKTVEGVTSPENGTRADKFWRLVDKGEPDECWEWDISVDSGGYGRFQSSTLAHRFAYKTEVEDPGNLNVNHHCDNKACVNPNHLYAGTQKDNMEDAKDRGQIKIGENHPHAKLTEDEAIRVKELADNGVQHGVISDRFDVSRPLVSNIAVGRKWSHL